ncbi:MAG: DUF4143 domain-containing protein [Muribaculaceae bacterium]|nr:DUF4143 domain-containing protein [Muribaculaceae bacterium]
MKRKIYSKLLKWKEQWNGRSALLIDGARRVGKSWIVEEFARNEYKSYILIDFNNVPRGILELFDDSLVDMDSFFGKLSIFTGVKLYNRQSVIIFDEVQLCPKARASIKYLVKDGRYDYIETGSLVSINHNVKNIIIPSEEVRVNMYPMDLEEFAWATGNEMLYDYIKTRHAQQAPMGMSLHRKAMEMMRAYILVGGMPQAVQAYSWNKDFMEAEAIKRSIIDLYRNDIAKYAGRQAAKVAQVFNNIPSALQRHEKKFRPSGVRKGARMRDFADAMFWLDESRVVNFCYGATEPSVALALNRDEGKVKLYMSDTGLLVSMAFDESELQKADIYEKILRGKLEFNKGMLTENFVAQQLRTAGHPLYFYSNSSRENAADRMEIDFMICKTGVTSRHNINAIEVKSGSGYALTSLIKCQKKFSQYMGRSYVLHTGDVKKEGDIMFLPIYMAGLL